MEKGLYIGPIWRMPLPYRFKLCLYSGNTKVIDGKECYHVIFRVRSSSFCFNTTLTLIETKAWDPKTKDFKLDETTLDGKPISEIENKLNSIHLQLKNYLNSLSSSAAIDEVHIKEIVRKALSRKHSGRTVSADYLSYIVERSKSKHWADSTSRREMYVRKLFLDYIGSYSYPDFDAAFMESFTNHLLKTLSEENTKKLISSVGSFLKWAREHGKNVPDEHYVYRYTRAAAPVVYLSKSELCDIIQCQIPPSGSTVKLFDMHRRRYEKKICGSDGLSLVRDIFLFLCLTGLRWAEAQLMKDDNIRDGKLSFITPKTGTPRSITINCFAQAIIDKYKDIPGRNGYLFPRLSNQKANSHLHDLAEICGINEPVTRIELKDGQKIEKITPKYKYITTHIGRKTFVCHALLAGISPELVTLWTGHASVDDMKPYIAASGEAQQQSMESMYYNTIIKNE